MNNEDVYLSDMIHIIEEVLAEQGTFRMYPRGISMLPLIVPDVDSVVLERRSGNEIQKHDIALYRRDNGQFVLHRVMKCCSDHTYIMCGDNQLLFEKGIRTEQIIGYVSQLYKGDRLLSFGSAKYKIYVFFWCWMPYRRIVKFVKKVFRFIKRKVFGNQ